MKKITLITIICFANIINATAQEGWSVGIITNPSYYWLYNQNDFTADRSVMYPVSPSAPNSFTAGAEIAYNFAENFGVKSGLNYSTNLQKYGSGTEEDRRLHFTIDFVSQLDYLQLPILFTANTTHDDDENRLSLFGEIGIVNAYLVHYKETTDSKSVDMTSYGSSVEENGNTDYHYVNPNFEKKGVYNGDWLYNRFDLSLYGGVGLRYFINETVAIDLKLNGQYGLLDTDNKTAKLTVDGKEYSRWNINEPTKHRTDVTIDYGTTLADRQPTHNIKAGISIGASYYFTE